MASKLKISYVYFFSLLVFIYIVLLNFNLKISSSLLSKRKFNGVTLGLTNTGVSVNIKRRFFRKKWKTVQRAPIAHRQWSQEQYEFSYYTFDLFLLFNEQKAQTLVRNSLVGKDSFYTLNKVPAYLFNSSVLNFFKLKYYVLFDLFVIK